MIACPSCGKAHPSHLTRADCAFCGHSFHENYLCQERHCEYHTRFQPANRECKACSRTLIGEFSGREINWGASLYRVREFVGGGGMGEVYRAIEQNQAGTYEREVAIKFNKNVMDRDIVKRFELEMQILGMLQSPHNVNVLTNGELYDERATGMQVTAQFMVMELLKGTPLNVMLKSDTKPDLPHQIAIFTQVASALADAHEKGIIHRDLKPHNVMLETVGGEPFVKVFDFGLSRLTHSMDDRLSTTGVVMGTFRYMSPEQALGEDTDIRTDIFSLGVVMYEMLTGQHPFPAKNLFELFMHHQQGPPAIQGSDPRLVEIVMKTLAYERDSRYQSMLELKSELQMFLGETLSGHVFVSQLSMSDSISTLPSGSLANALSQESEDDNTDPSIIIHPNVTNPGDPSVSSGNPPVKAQEPSEEEGSNTMLLVALGVVMLLLGVVGGLYLFRVSQKKKKKNNGGGIVVVTPKNNRRAPVRVQPRRLRVAPPVRRQIIPRRVAVVPRPLKRVVKRRVVRRPVRRRWRPRRRWKPRYRRRVVVRRVVPRPVVRRAPVVVRRVEPPPRIVPRPVVRRVAAVIRRVAPPPRPVVRRPTPRPCPLSSRPVSYSQLDRAMGRSFNTKIARLLNSSARSNVYDAGLSLSQSWKRAPIICKKSYLCGRVQRLVQRYCRRYKPRSDCSGYKAAQRRVGGRLRFVCVR